MLTETVTWVHHWSDRTFSFKCTRSDKLKFTAGQFILIGMIIDDAVIVRAYSIVSSPDVDELEFLSVIIVDGELTSQLQHITVGSAVVMFPKATGTLLNSALTSGGALWMLATGTGLAPFMSLLRHVGTAAKWSTIHLVHSVQDAADLAYRDELVAKPNLRYHTQVTGLGDSRVTPDWLVKQGLNTDLDKVMVCGNTGFNKDMATWLESQGMTEGSAKTPGHFVVERAFVDRG